MGIIRDTIRALFGVKAPKKEVKCEPPKYDPNPKVARVKIQNKPKPDIPKVNPKVVGVKVTTETRPDPILDAINPLNPLNPLSPISPLNPLNQGSHEPVRHRDHHERADSTTISNSHRDSSQSYDHGSRYHSGYDSSPSHHDSSW